MTTISAELQQAINDFIAAAETASMTHADTICFLQGYDMDSPPEHTIATAMFQHMLDISREGGTAMDTPATLFSKAYCRTFVDPEGRAKYRTEFLAQPERQAINMLKQVGKQLSSTYGDENAIAQVTFLAQSSPSTAH